MGLKSLFRDWLVWIDGEIKKNRPNRLRRREVPPETIVIPLTPQEFRRLAAGGDPKGRLSNEEVEKYITDSLRFNQAFEFHNEWLIIKKEI